MKKTTIKERFENARNAFFENDNFENTSLVCASETNLSQQNSTVTLTKKADLFLKILKQTFLFLPGTFFLFNLTLFTTVTNLDPTIAQLERANLLIVALAVSAFMTIFGLGNIRNPKHLIIPASIVLFAILSGAFVIFLGGGLKFIETYALYLLPIALMLPVLAKGWIDSPDEIKPDLTN